MVHYKATMRHDEKSFEKLAHMQYDLFCKTNLIIRTLLSFGLLILGIMNYTTWWGVLVIFYASYLGSSKYASANHTAHKLAKQIKSANMEFPVSRFEFQDNAIDIISMPENKSSGDPLSYADVFSLSEDVEYFYLFRNQYGGYMIPKSELGGKEDEFRAFVEGKTGKVFRANVAPIVKLLRRIDVKQRLKKR